LQRGLSQPLTSRGRRFSDGCRIQTAHRRHEPVACGLASGHLCRRIVAIASAWWVSKCADLLRRKLRRTVAAFFLYL